MARPLNTKKETSYGAGKEVTHCGNCANFVPDEDPFEPGDCKKVIGPVEWFKWCRLWQALS